MTFALIGRQTVVVGAGMAGLLAVRTLADYFEVKCQFLYLSGLGHALVGAHRARLRRKAGVRSRPTAVVRFRRQQCRPMPLKRPSRSARELAQLVALRPSRCPGSGPGPSRRRSV
jgi:hypothetical protein